MSRTRIVAGSLAGAALCASVLSGCGSTARTPGRRGRGVLGGCATTEPRGRKPQHHTRSRARRRAGPEPTSEPRETRERPTKATRAGGPGGRSPAGRGLGAAAPQKTRGTSQGSGRRPLNMRKTSGPDGGAFISIATGQAAMRVGRRMAEVSGTHASHRRADVPPRFTRGPGSAARPDWRRTVRAGVHRRRHGQGAGCQAWLRADGNQALVEAAWRTEAVSPRSSCCCSVSRRSPLHPDDSRVERARCRPNRQLRSTTVAPDALPLITLIACCADDLLT